MGGSAHQDGISGVDTHGGNCAILSAEVWRPRGLYGSSRRGLSKVRAETGEHKGGLGIEREYEMLTSGLVVSGYTQQTQPETAPWGVDGGAPGGLAAAHIIRRNGLVEDLTSKWVAVPLEAGERIRLRAAGGAGWGRPTES